MPCLLAILALGFPRFVLAIVWIFSNLLQSVYQTAVWPVLGFFFMPLTTLAYAYAIDTGGGVRGGYLAIYVVAALIDLGLVGGTARGGVRRRRRRKR